MNMVWKKSVLYGAYPVGDTVPPTVPGIVPSHWSLWKADHTGLRGQTPGQFPLILSPPLLRTANNVALSSLWKTLGIVPQEIVKRLKENSQW